MKKKKKRRNAERVLNGPERKKEKFIGRSRIKGGEKSKKEMQLYIRHIKRQGGFNLPEKRKAKLLSTPHWGGGGGGQPYGHEETQGKKKNHRGEGAVK